MGLSRFSTLEATDRKRKRVVENGVSSGEKRGEETLDGQHGKLLPGFLDSHVHLMDVVELEHGTHWGCTIMELTRFWGGLKRGS